ncbi:TIGR01440 family protein [Shimazuella sp. AN120528]|uniref:TIGR01440 family protein n=1 Tax=Shimazuella soli TaxID=1892854 RepID=UPI001F0FE573|nr:TIGR01440 family protein [Shimazuella soli]MCH5585192.1 TIGR01440 family protein [Shimazuella soli]
MEQIHQETVAALQDLLDAFPLDEQKLLVVGVSTSEVLGERIGSYGSDRVAESIYEVFSEYRQRFGFMLAFQCCEHLNRALVVSRETATRLHLTEVAAVPVRHAGGAMASYAFRQLPDSILVESIAADAGIDIGSTLIGMHLKPVAVPVRPKKSYIGQAYVTMARTRPKLIGGSRAVYILENE